MVRPIVLHCDLKVDPAREAEMLDHFHARFRPTAERFEGFIDLKMLKLREVLQGEPMPPRIGYRFQLTYRSEALRQLWVASPEHEAVWPGVAACLLDPNVQVILWDDA